MKDELLQFGLEEKEAVLYLACLAKKENSPTELARKTNFKRATVYFYLEKLRQKELVVFDVRGARRRVSVARPRQAFARLLRTKKENLEREERVLRDMVSKLEQIRPDDGLHSHVYVYEGEDGARFAIRKILEKKANIYWLGSFETLLGIMSEQRLYKLLTAPRLKQGTISYAITDRRILKYPRFSNIIGNKRLYRFLEKDFDVPAVVGLFADTICLLTKDGGNIRVVLIEDQLMHDVVQVLFSHMWSSLSRER